MLSDRSLTENTGMAVMCPITTKPRGLPYEVALEDTSTQGVVLPTQVKSVDVYARKVKFIERAPVQVVARVQQLVISMVEG